MLTCDVCQTKMSQSKEWYYTCSECLYKKSTLQSGAGADISGLESLRRENFVEILSILDKLVDPKSTSILEVGSSEGWFLDEAKKSCYKVDGIEPDTSKKQSKYIQENNVYFGFFPEILDESFHKKYDVVIFNDVFEHLPDPKAALKAVDYVLKDSGILILNLPSSSGIFYKVAKIASYFISDGPLERLWQKGQNSPHISYFNPLNLKKFVHDFSPLKIIKDTSLSTLSLKGLYKRMKGSFSAPITLAIYCVVVVAYPFLALLPKDICLQFYRK